MASTACRICFNLIGNGSGPTGRLGSTLAAARARSRQVLQAVVEPFPARPAQAVLRVEKLKQRPVPLAHHLHDLGGNAARCFEVFIRDRHLLALAALTWVQPAFARFQTMTPVPSVSFSKKAARIGLAKLGSSSLTAR